MALIKKIAKYLCFVLVIPLVYSIVSLISTYITVNSEDTSATKEHTVYLSSNGVHLEIIIPRSEIAPAILEGLTYTDEDLFFSFGWGDKTFYVETPTWADLTFINGFRALFVNTSTLLHVTRYNAMHQDWAAIKMTSQQLHRMNKYVLNAFRLDQNQQKILLPGIGYYKNDDFYEATGNYNCFNTCNTWVNSGLKQSEAKACLWTPYDFRLIDLYQN